MSCAKVTEMDMEKLVYLQFFIFVMKTGELTDKVRCGR